MDKTIGAAVEKPNKLSGMLMSKSVGLYIVVASFVATPAGPATLLTVKFGPSAGNDKIVPDAVAALSECGVAGGGLVLINGPASLPVAIALGHGVAHKFGAVGCFDPKLAAKDGEGNDLPGGAYVIAVSHDAELPVGAMISGSQVKPATEG